MANERRLIDLNNLVLQYGGLAHISALDFAGICKYFVEQLEKQPIIDATEVVRCRDCGYCKQSDQINYLCMRVEGCQAIRGVRRPDDFCSFGERRAGEWRENK